MQVKISARHGHLSDETQQTIKEKAEKLLHYFSRITMIQVTVDLKSELQKSVEVVVSAEHKQDIVARESHPDTLAALNLVIDKLERQLSRYKEKIQDHRRDRPAGVPAVPEETVEE